MSQGVSAGLGAAAGYGAGLAASVGTAALIGATAGSVGALVRARWSHALDDPHEVLILQQVDDESEARRWLHDSDAAADWLTEAGVGAYPPVFIGTFAHMMRI